MSQNEKGQSGKGQSGAAQKNWLEWSVFALSLLLVGGTLVYLAREALTLDDVPPKIVLTLGKPRPLDASPGGSKSFILPVKAANHGQQTAEGVHVQVEMRRAGEEPQTADFEIEFLPRDSEREGWVGFKGEPEGIKLDARVLGYEIP